jgi:hypothetical protein
MRLIATKRTNVSQYPGVAAGFYLPKAPDGVIAPATGGVSPHCYIGLTQGAISIDAGVSFAPDQTLKGVHWKHRWNATLRISDKNGKPGYFPDKGMYGDRVLGERKGFKFIDASQNDNIVKVGLRVVTNQKACVFHCEGSDFGGPYYRTSYVAAVNLAPPQTNFPEAATHYRLKRVLSLDQNKSYEQSHASQYSDFKDVPVGLQSGAVRDGSYMKGIFVSTRLFDGNNWFDWLDSYTDTSDTRWDYFAQWKDGTVGPVTFPLLPGQPHGPRSDNEWVSIQH